MRSPLIRSTCLVAALAAVPPALSGCAGEAPPPPRDIVRAVKMEVFGQSRAKREYAYPGKVYANQTVDVAFEVSGKLAALPVTKGQEVKAGTILAELDRRDFANELDQAQALKAEADATHARYQQAYEKRAVSRQELDEAASRMRIASAEVKLKEKALEDSTIRAPMDGIVADRLVDNFQNVDAKQPVLVLQDVSRLEVRINIPERDISESGADTGRISASFDVVPGREFELAVKEFVTDADPVTQTYPVTLWMATPAGAGLLPGMTATVHWYPPTAEAQAVRTVPITAVLGQAGRPSAVWVVDTESETVDRREVEIGAIVQGDRVEVVSGIEAGETVATAGAHHLSPGIRVREYRQ